jgi:Flp pilus assembly protein protease CpaA
MSVGLDFAGMLLIAGVVAAAVYDMRSRLIPNTLTYTLVLAGVSVAIIDGHIYSSAVALGLCLAMVFPLYFAGMLGGADLKLLTGVSLFGDWHMLLECLVMTVLLGAIWALVCLAPRIYSRCVNLMVRVRSPDVEQSAAHAPAPTIPLAVPIAAAVVCTHLLGIKVLV